MSCTLSLYNTICLGIHDDTALSTAAHVTQLTSSCLVSTPHIQSLQSRPCLASHMASSGENRDTSLQTGKNSPTFLVLFQTNEIEQMHKICQQILIVYFSMHTIKIVWVMKSNGHHRICNKRSARN